MEARGISIMTWVEQELPSEAELREQDKEIHRKGRFLVDESLDRRVNDILRALGWNTKVR